MARRAPLPIPANANHRDPDLTAVAIIILFGVATPGALVTGIACLFANGWL